MSTDTSFNREEFEEETRRAVEASLQEDNNNEDGDSGADKGNSGAYEGDGVDGKDGGSADDSGSPDQDNSGEPGADEGGSQGAEGAREGDGEGKGDGGDGTGGPDPQLIAQAVSIGIPYGVVQRAGSNEDVYKLIEGARQFMALRRRAAQQGKNKQEDPLDSIPDLSEEDYDPEVVKAFKAVKAFAKKQQEKIQQLEQQTQYVGAAAQERVVEEVENWFDQRVQSLGENYKDILGGGRYRELPEASPQRAKRDEIANKVSALMVGYRATGQRPPSRDDLFDEAVRLVLKDSYGKGAAQEGSGEGQGGRRRVERPSGKKATKKITPFEQAAQMIDEKFF